MQANGTSRGRPCLDASDASVHDRQVLAERVSRSSLLVEFIQYRNRYHGSRIDSWVGPLICPITARPAARVVLILDIWMLGPFIHVVLMLTH